MGLNDLQMLYTLTQLCLVILWEVTLAWSSLTKLDNHIKQHLNLMRTLPVKAQHLHKTDTDYYGLNSRRHSMYCTSNPIPNQVSHRHMYVPLKTYAITNSVLVKSVVPEPCWQLKGQELSSNHQRYGY
ncbi:hypothetical protein GGR54DRAFT_193810 [Hypoxylon sp. NC1633]|nr:hypothetical protein GGR54DRAFT_193810 [Hypoxylon sp. NC1633]